MSLQYVMFQCIEYERHRKCDAPLQREWVQKILGFDMVRQDGQITNDSRIYLCFKVEGRIPVMLLLYVDDLFLKENRNSLKLLTRRGSLLPSLK